MKRIYILLLAIPLMATSSPLLQKIDQLVEKIKTKRVGLHESSIYQAKDPFVYFIIKQKEDKQIKVPIVSFKARKPKAKKTFRLRAIIGERVKINNRWYTLGDQVGRYRLVDIASRYALLKRKGRLLKIWLISPKNSNIMIQTR